MRKLTIGMATYEDYDGIYFTIQSIRMFHPEILDQVEFVVIDNSPNSEHGKCVRNFLDKIKEPSQYLPFTKYNSTSVRNKIFDLAETPYVMSIDSHVFIVPGAIKKLIDFYDANQDSGNLLQGPLVYDDLYNVSTHFDLKWGHYMWGKWGTDERGIDQSSEPFEIPAQGCGLFSCRKDNWLYFNSEFRGFGGEEGYIHEKYRKNGKKTLCLPFLRWMHRFDRPNGVPYPNSLKDRYRNYLIGFTELGLDISEVKDNFKSALTQEDMEKIENNI
jgi:hypothetical protein